MSTEHRTNRGERADAPRIRATFDGETIEAVPGASIAAALLASGRTAWRTTRDGEARGLFCGIGVCFDCLVEIDGESGQRACMIPLAEGMVVRSAVGPERTETAPAEPGESRGCCGGGCCGAQAEARREPHSDEPRNGAEEGAEA